MLRYVDIKTRIKRLLDEAATSAITDNLDDIIDDTVNASHRRVCQSRTWPFLRWPREESFVTVAGTRTYALNNAVGKLMHVWDSNLNVYLPMIPLRNWEMQSVDRSIQIDNSGVIFGGFWPVAVQPSGAETVTIVSSSASDTGATKTVFIRGLNSSGVLTEETLTSSGLTPVNSTSTYIYLLNVTKIGTWVGTLTVSTTLRGTLLTLSASEYAKQYPTLEFVETPAGVKTFTYAFQRVPRTLSQDNDIPEIPFPFSELLVYDALVEIATYATSIDAGHVAIWSQRRDSILKQMNEAQDELIIGAQPRVVRDLDFNFGRRVGYV